MSITPEREAELLTQLEEAGGLGPLPKPKVVARDGVVKRSAKVWVSRADPNADGSNRIVELGVDEGFVDGRLTIVGYWTLMDGKPHYVRVERPANHVERDYNPFSKGRM